MSAPVEGSNKYSVMLAIYKKGPLTMGQICELLTSRSREAVKQAIYNCSDAGEIHRGDNGKYSLALRMQNYFDGAQIKCTVSTDLEIVQPRTAPEFRPMKNYAASMQPRRECDPLRDGGFKNGSTDFRSFVGYRI